MKTYLDIIKSKSKNYIKTNILFLTFVLTSVLNASLLRFLTVKNYFEVKALIADLAVVIIIGAFGYFIKPKHQFKYFLIWSVLFTAICVVNSLYYTNYMSFASVSLLATSSQVADVGDAVLENVLEPKDFTYFWQIFVLFFVHKKLKSKKYYDEVSKIEKGKVSALNTLVVGIIFIGFFISTLNGLEVSRFGKQWNREYLVMKFGLYTYQVNDVVKSLEPVVNTLFGFEEKLKVFNEFYDNKDNEIKVNEYTNALKGKNVIAIHAESIQTFLIGKKMNGKEITPNLNKLIDNGLYFSNFYAQEGVGTSSDTEFTLNTSMLPASSGTVFINYYNREFVTLPKLLKEQNYYTFSMHGNNGTFWNRNVVHKNFGYDKFFYYKKDYEIDEVIGLGLSDKSFFRQSIPYIKEIDEANKNFYGLAIMLTNHTPFSDIVAKNKVDFDVTMQYEVTNPETGEKETKTADYLKGTKMGNYIKSVHYADQALGEFIDGLDEQGLLENTAIVIYGDHDAKLKKSEFRRYYNYDPETDSLLDKEDPNYIPVDFFKYELDRKVPFIIWTKDGKLTKKVDKVMGMYDVLPTLGNMLGVRSPYALGNDIFSIDENIVVFPDGNWVTDKMYYNGQKEEGKLLTAGDTITEDYISKYNEYSSKLLEVSNATIIYDLIKASKEAKGESNEELFEK